MRVTRDDALLWLNDRLGKSVHVSVVLEKGDLPVTVLEAEGELHHWRESETASASAGLPREDLIGWYAVGGARFDLSDLEHLHVDVGDDAIAIELAEDVALEIVEQSRLGTE